MSISNKATLLPACMAERNHSAASGKRAKRQHLATTTRVCLSSSQGQAGTDIFRTYEGGGGGGGRGRGRGRRIIKHAQIVLHT